MAQIWGPQHERCRISIKDRFDMHNSDADVRLFLDRLENDLKRKNVPKQLKSGKLHTILCT